MSDLLTGAIMGAKVSQFKNSEYNKGSIENTAGHAYKQTKNTIKGLAKDAFILTTGTAATAGTAAVVSKSKTDQKGLSVLGTKILSHNFTPLLEKIGPFVLNAAKFTNSAIERMSALPKSAKIIVAAGAVITGLLIQKNNNKTLYDSGKISQEYTDKQKISEIL